jgi:hypothetical protein
MRLSASACAAVLFAQTGLASESAGLVGIMNTSGTVDVDGFTNPKSIYTLYVANDPSESNTLLAYVAYREVGTHKLTISWTDSSGAPVDRCDFDALTVKKVPWINTVTCHWGGRLPSGGISFSVMDTFNGSTQKVGEMYIPAKK